MTTDITSKFFIYMEVFVMSFEYVVRYSLVLTFVTGEHVPYFMAWEKLMWTGSMNEILMSLTQ